MYPFHENAISVSLFPKKKSTTEGAESNAFKLNFTTSYALDNL
jgi:hypothetical protein